MNRTFVKGVCVNSMMYEYVQNKLQFSHLKMPLKSKRRNYQCPVGHKHGVKGKSKVLLALQRHAMGFGVTFHSLSSEICRGKWSASRSCLVISTERVRDTLIDGNSTPHQLRKPKGRLSQVCSALSSWMS